MDAEWISRTFERVLRRDRAITIALLILVVGNSWAYILAGGGSEMPSMMTAGGNWDLGYSIVMLVMWWVMMLAMMLPSATPMILMFVSLNRQRPDGSIRAVLTFVSAYVLSWGAFSVVATLLQWGLEKTGFLSSTMASTNAILGASLLIAAGIWQLTPLKYACLRHCRSPFNFFLHKWRNGPSGAFKMGLEYGVFCLGCCWVLMALLFYGGVMNLWWIAGLALYVLVEKVAPAGHWIGHGTGGLLIAWGLWIFVAL